MLTACLCLSGSCRAEPDGTSQAWFYSTVSLRPSTNPELWCSFVTEASAEAAANSDRFEPTESGWLRYRGDVIESLMVMSQSEDAYVEDTYTFGQDLTVTQVDRKGHYVDDPFARATFKPDSDGRLAMTDESRSALRSWQHTTYFLDWPLYATFSEIPFAELIAMEPDISVSEACHQTKP
jgi:hypothetical protein